MTTKTVIVEDESKLAEVLNIKIKNHLPDLKVMGKAYTVEEAYNLICSVKPDLLFLDVTLPDGTGFDLLDRFDIVNFEVIFVTGYAEYALDALKVSAIDYLLKPVRTSDLITAVEKAQLKIRRTDLVQNYELLKFNLGKVGQQDSKIVIPESNSYEVVEVKDIIRCQGHQKYTQIYMSGNKKILSSYNIGTYINMLSSYGFFSTHKSHLINTNWIQRYLTEGIVVMKDGSKVPVSRRRKIEFTQSVLDL